MNSVDKLKALKEKGKMIITPEYMIYYNPFTDAFCLDVPDKKKMVSFFAVHELCIGERFYYDMAGMYPYSAKTEGKTYEEIWKELEPYLNGATTKLIPTSYTSGCDEYIWVTTDENGLIPLSRSVIIPIDD
ncbi:MAG: hypothetical protein IKH63_14630 [Prevotella sp.]|nr:hypothetical protein [Prevotella sp.]